MGIDATKMPLPELRMHKFDPSDGLDMTEVAMLAVANNPDLKLARDDARIAHAQAFAAGLLPDPQFGLSRDFPRQTGAGITSAFNAGLAYDLGSLVSHAAGASASGFESRKTDLALLWQEWQVVAQARLLFSRAISQETLLHWLAAKRDAYARRYAGAQSALRAGNITIDALNASLLAWQDTSRQVSDLERQLLQTRNDLKALLGLAPETELDLVAGAAPGVPDEKQVTQALADLPKRRPDLLALRAGFDAGDARYRQAILAQFPPLNLAMNAARDTSGLYTNGFVLSLALPLLNGNRGNIRVAEATRQRLRDEYQVRLNAAYAQVKNLLADDRLIAAQLHSAEAGLKIFDDTTAKAGQALAEGELDANAYAIFQSSRIARHVEASNLRESLMESRIALLTLLGGNLDTRTAVPEHSR